MILCTLGLNICATSPANFCCAEADGHPLDDGEWDMKNDSYRVFFQGKWATVPGDAVIVGPNKFGKAIVWLLPPDVAAWGGPVSNPIICFMPGSAV